MHAFRQTVSTEKSFFFLFFCLEYRTKASELRRPGGVKSRVIKDCRSLFFRGLPKESFIVSGLTYLKMKGWAM